MELFDVIGYAGTVLVIVSFLCQSIIKLRILNAVGAFFVTVYAISSHAWPVALLDGFIVVINVFQLFRYRTTPTLSIR